MSWCYSATRRRFGYNKKKASDSVGGVLTHVSVLSTLDSRSTTAFKFTSYLLSSELLQAHSLRWVRVWNCLSRSPIPRTCQLSAVFLSEVRIHVAHISKLSVPIHVSLMQPLKTYYRTRSQSPFFFKLKSQSQCTFVATRCWMTTNRVSLPIRFSVHTFGENPKLLTGYVFVKRSFHTLNCPSRRRSSSHAYTCRASWSVTPPRREWLRHPA